MEEEPPRDQVTSEWFELPDGTVVFENAIVMARHYKPGQNVVLNSRHYEVLSSTIVGSVKRVVVRQGEPW